MGEDEARLGVALFAKAPRPGRAKTRLGRGVGHEAASELYAAFLEDLVGRFGANQTLSLTIWAAAQSDVEALEALGHPVRIQPDADLGVRMASALDETLRRHPRALVLGSDAPTLPVSRLLDADLALRDGADLVLGPAVDGGYYLVGARAPGFDFGTGIRWSTPYALDDTLDAAARQGRSVARLRPFYDVDTREDLRLLALGLAVRPAHAPATAAVMRRLRTALPPF